MTVPNRFQKKSAPASEQNFSRRKKVLISAGILFLLLLIAGAVWFYGFRADQESDLPPEQRIRQNFRKAFNPEESTLERLASLRRSFKAARNIPPEKRHPVIVEALAESVNRTFSDFAGLKPEQKPERAEMLREDALRTLKYFRSFSREQQKKALSLLANTPGGRAQLHRAIDMTANELSPEDRKLLGPTIKIWKTMLEDVR